MSVWCGTWSDMSDMSDKSDFISVPQVQKTEGRQKPPQSLTAKPAGNPHKKVRVKGGSIPHFTAQRQILSMDLVKFISKEVISKISRNKRKE